MTGRLFAIGDIHGHVDALHHLLGVLDLAADDFLVFCGDYIDRGPDSAAVIETVRQLAAHPNVVTLRGNHEDMMLQAAIDAEQFELWMVNGAPETLRSYGRDPRRTSARNWQHAVPGDHWKFLLDHTRHWFETPQFLFVHGGLRPDQHPSWQDAHPLMWTRLDEFRGPHISRKLVVVGHTPQDSRRPKLREDGVLAIDTGMGYPEGRLTAVDLANLLVYQADDRGARRPYLLIPPEREPRRRHRRPGSRARLVGARGEELRVYESPSGKVE